MKIIKLHFSRLRNAEHFQFFTEFCNLVNRFGAETLKVGKRFSVLLDRYKVEDECLFVLQKSGYTEQMDIADRRRDATFRGLADSVNAALNHFNTEVAAAAKLLKIVFDSYGNLAKRPLDEETSGIYNLVTDLETKYAAEVQLTGIGQWVAELKADNERYGNLVKNRDVESSEKPEAKVRRVRVEIEAPYRDITAAIEVFAMLSDSDTEEEAMYHDFIGMLNAVVERYKNRMAQREGISAAAAVKTAEEERFPAESAGENETETEL